MSSQILPQPRRPLYGLWIAGGGILLAGLAAALYAGFVHFSGPIKLAYGFVSGNPAIPNCTMSVVSEDTAGPLWYRVVDVTCPGESMHFVYARRGTGPGFFVLPALVSTGDPIPASVRQAGEGAYEIVLQQPLADGQTSLPIEFDRNGMVSAQFFDHGIKKSKSTFGG